MLKYNHKPTVTGDIDITAGTVTAINKKSEITGVYKLIDLFTEFDGKSGVAISITENYERNDKDIDEEDAE